MNFTPPWIADVRDTALTQRLQHLLDRKTKPLGSLGQLETLALNIGLVQQTERPQLSLPQLVVFAADHGLTARGVSAYPKDVTWQMVENFLSGGAAVSVIARQHGLALTVVDAGVDHEFAPRPNLLDRKVAHGTADASRQAAMSPEQCVRALEAGREVVRGLPGNVLLLGEMGIGNSASAALLLARLTGEPLSRCVGRGTGLDNAGLAHKVAVLAEVLQHHRDASTPLQVLAALGGLEIAMLTGAMLEAAAQRRVVLVDGFIAGAAALVASRLAPAVLGYFVLSHRSAETGHALLLQHLDGQPLLDLGLRLGEASGAALAWPLLRSAVLLLNEMASFDAAGVSEASSVTPS